MYIYIYIFSGPGPGPMGTGLGPMGLGPGPVGPGAGPVRTVLRTYLPYALFSSSGYSLDKTDAFAKRTTICDPAN